MPHAAPVSPELDPGPLLAALCDVLDQEAELLDSGEADQITDIVERKDSLCHQLSIHPALRVSASGKLGNALSPDTIKLLERCDTLNRANGERIARRRQMVQERMARLSNQVTYGASGGMDHRTQGNWSASV